MTVRSFERLFLWPPCIADADIIFCSCGFYLLHLFYLAYSQQSGTGCLPYFHTWYGFSMNCECMAEMRCTPLAENTGLKNNAKNCHLRTIAQCCRAISSQLRYVSTIGKKPVKQQYLVHMSWQYGKLRPTNGRDCCSRWGTLANFNEFCILSALLHWHSSTEVN